MPSVDEVAAGLSAVRERIAAAAARVGRCADEVTLVAVSKFQPADRVRAAIAEGQADFGENYAQALRDRVAEFGGAPLRWHAIGPLQRNKATIVAERADVFHALDRVEVAAVLGRARLSAGRVPLPCLVEVNLGGEATKAGIEPAALGSFLSQVEAIDGLAVVGLMTMPPLSPDPEAMREHFAALRRLAEHYGLAELSMGTTDDYPVAVEEGATLVRVGRAVFGERPPRS